MMPTSTRSKAPGASPHSLSLQPSSGSTVPYSDVRMGGLQPPTSPLVRNDAPSSASSETVQGFQSVAEYMQELMDAMRKLDQLGVERSNIPVPKIVVTGDQSAGKSSFIEAISQISVPRNAGTCTRCPIQITTSSSDTPWRCSVKLVKKYHYFDREYLASQPEGDCFPPGIFYPWQEASQATTVDFANLDDPADVCEMIERAQAATLHPSQDHTEFRSGALPSSTESEVKFSPNYISLEISGPNLPNLSFYDLPGVIRRTRDHKENYLVGLVENLVCEYIKEESAIVLLACPLEQDPDTSNTSGLILKAGAEGRCVGVLTKPDRLAVGTKAEGWDEILSGNAFQLGHGYYVTKQPDQTQLNLTHSEARSLEDLFFARQAPWSTELAHHSARFGTKNIQTALTRLLFGQITALLPEIRQRLAARLQLVGEDLAKLPEVPTAEVVYIVSSCLSSFNEQVRALIRGSDSDNAFRTKWNEEMEKFRLQIQELRPRLQLNMPQDTVEAARLIKGSPIKSKPMDVMDLTGENVGTPTRAQTPAPTHTSATPRKRKKEDPFSTPSTPVNKRLSMASNDGVVFTLDQIRALLHGHSAVGQRADYDRRAVERLKLQSLRWDQISKTFYADSLGHLNASLKTILKACLHGYEKTKFFETLQTSVKTFLAAAIKQFQQRAHILLKYEQREPSSLYVEAIDAATDTALKELKEARFRARAKRYLEVQAEVTGKPLELDQMLWNAKEKLALQNALGADPAEREVDVMSKIRGYYTVASMRYADNLYRAFEAEVFGPLETRLKDYLEKEVLFCEDNMQDRCAELLAEDPAREHKRIKLKHEKEHLRAASQMLDDLANKYGANPCSSNVDEAMF